ncbi:MAG TPA: FeoB small GTPase domain-containing protein [Armatimonadota bacterium]
MTEAVVTSSRRPTAPFFRLLGNALRGARRAGTCDCVAVETTPDAPCSRKLLIVGSPNVGKSVLFNRLTGRYVVVSNYPGTTVEVSRGRARIGGESYEIIDTPGMYSLRPVSDEERAGRALMLAEKADLVVHVVDAKNLDRMLPFTLQLVEAGFPVVLAVNMMDEAGKLGLRLRLDLLSQKLGLPVVGTVAVKGHGLEELRNVIAEHAAAGAAAL